METMVKRRFAARDYVWDVVRDGPAVIVEVDEIDDAAVCPYVVAEIINNAGHNRLGGVARRSDSQLERYVKLLVPEREAVAFARTGPGGRLIEGLRGRVVVAMEKRGITWSR
jgi:hypothetical protein